MIKKILIAILIALPLSVAAQVKIGVIDLQTLVTETPEFTEAQNTLKASQEKYQADLRSLQEEAQRAFDDYNKLKEDATTPAAMLERREQALNEMSQKIQQTAQTYDQRLQQQEQELMAPIVDKVQKAAQAVGQEKGLTCILPTGAFIYMSADVLDVNPLVKEKLAK
ncbi:MAG: OmpH family outer membrane protein [Muribaculaceae bacterium]|nr:OmpH family outer membrane protein [Muribaculaceae bacterium]